MKFRKLILPSLSILLAACSMNISKPKLLMLNAYKASQEVQSVKADGTLELSVTLGQDALTIPIDMTVVLDNHDKKDQSDNEVYVSVDIPMLGVENYQMWVRDNVMYIDDGQSKRLHHMNRLRQPPIYPQTILSVKYSVILTTLSLRKTVMKPRLP